MLLSCLSAHAALAVFDGIERLPLATKCTGVFAQQTDPGSPLAEGLGRSIPLPHSRRNNVPIATMRAAGYDLPLYSGEAGWSVATRTVRRSAVVLMQAHPEYGATSLLREYQRDARRYRARGAGRAAGPPPAVRCAPATGVTSWSCSDGSSDGERRPGVSSSPSRSEPLGTGLHGRGGERANRLYANWLATAPIKRPLTRARRDHRHPRRLCAGQHPGGGRSHLPDRGPRLHRRRACRCGAGPRGARLPLQPDQQSHQRRPRAADGGAGRRVGRAGPGLGNGRRQLLHPHGGHGRFERRGGPPALRGHLHLLRPRPAHAGHRGQVRARRPGRVDRRADR